MKSKMQQATNEIKKEIKAYYNERAQEYEEIYAGKGHITLDPRSYLEDVVKISETASQFGRGHLIDIACGTGFWLPYYARNCTKITLLDQSEKMLKECARKVEALHLTSVTIMQGDFLEVSLEPSTFDSAFVGFFVSHLTPEQEKVFFHILRRILKPDSHVMMVDSVWNSERQKHRKKEGIQERTLNDGRTFHVYKRYFEKSDIDRICEEYDVESTSFYSGNAFIAAVFEI